MIRLTSAMLAGLLVLASAMPLQARQDDAVASKLAQLLDQSEYKFTKVRPNVWTIPFTGKSMKDFRLFVTSGQSGTDPAIFVIGAVVAPKGEMRVTLDMAQTLLGMADRIDRVKIGIDKDGDLFVRVEISANVTNAEEFKLNVEQVAAAADEIHKGIKKFLK